jgi:formamidopyrimidine-DNA glycosylase
MPELPEVETIVRGLRAAGLPGARIAGVDVRCARIVGGAPEVLRQTVVGRRVVRVGRRGKYIVVDLDEGARVLIHLRMTGKLRFGDAGTPLGPHDHVSFTLGDDRRLIYNDTRRFGRILPCGGADPLAPLGPEPLESAFTPACLARRLAGRRRQIKPLLLDQTVVAGLGNIYVDEALWAARIHPGTPAARLGPAELRRLHRAIRHVLSVAVANQGTTLGRGQTNFYSVAGRRGRHADRLKVFRRDGQPCPRCGTTLARAVVAQRGTHFCPACQRLDPP